MILWCDFNFFSCQEPESKGETWPLQLLSVGLDHIIPACSLQVTTSIKHVPVIFLKYQFNKVAVEVGGRSGNTA